VDKVEALRVATEYHDRIRFDVKIDKPKAVRELAAFGLFSIKEISLILDMPFNRTEVEAGALVDLGPNNVGRAWNIHALSALYLLALDYRRGHVNESLLIRVAEDSNSLRAISELTDIPIERIREVVN
jgi:hypothetical protein